MCAIRESQTWICCIDVGPQCIPCCLPLCYSCLLQAEIWQPDSQTKVDQLNICIGAASICAWMNQSAPCRCSSWESNYGEQCTCSYVLSLHAGTGTWWWRGGGCGGVV